MSTSKVKPIHNTPPITREDFQAGYMKPQAYSAEDISKAIVDLVSRPREEYTKRQLRGLARFKSHGTWNFYKAENINDLRNWFDIFNDVFFNGVLTGYCTVAFHVPTRRGWYANVGAYCHTFYPGREHDPRFPIERPRCRISIRTLDSDWYKKHNPGWRARGYQSSLIHEMLHAVFGIYTCYCAGCREKNRSYLLRGSHDEPWLAAAHAIEQADKVVVAGEDDDWDDEDDGDRAIKSRGILGPSLELDLGKDVAVASAVHHGAKLPPDSELRRLGVDFMKVWEEMQEDRKDEAKKYRKEQSERQLMQSNQCLREYWIVEGEADFYEEPEQERVTGMD